MESEVTTLFPPMFPSEHLDSVEIVFREIGAGSKWRAVVETDFKLDVLLALIRSDGWAARRVLTIPPIPVPAVTLNDI